MPLLFGGCDEKPRRVLSVASRCRECLWKLADELVKASRGALSDAGAEYVTGLTLAFHKHHVMPTTTDGEMPNAVRWAALDDSRGWEAQGL